MKIVKIIKNNKIWILLLFLCIVLGFVYYNTQIYTFSPNNKISPNPNYDENKLEELLDNTSRLLNDNKVIFWLDAGTLLGVIREGNFIKHDTDMDISIYKEDKDKLHNLLNDKDLLQRYGITLIRDQHEHDVGLFSLKLINSTPTTSDTRFNNFDYIDIYVLNYKPLLETIYFKGKIYNIPKNPKLYLSLVYGKDWMIPNPNGVADENLWLSGFKGTTYSEQIVENVK